MTDPLARARVDADREGRAVLRHLDRCRWCATSPCPMAVAIRENAEGYRRHLAALAHEAALEAGIAWS